MTAPTAAGARELARCAQYRALWQRARREGCEDMEARALRRWQWHRIAARSWAVARHSGTGGYLTR